MTGDLHDVIRCILDDNSGGMKFTELLSRVLMAYHEGEISLEEHEIENLGDRIEACINRSTDIGMLVYTWVPMTRQKIFVYTP